MRFAYIDSGGKEVGIPTMDALRLRIALRAIVDDTVFFDQETDRWAPAAEHDVYLSLKKELDEQESGGFVAPPPETEEEEPEDAAELDIGGLEVSDLDLGGLEDEQADHPGDPVFDLGEGDLEEERAGAAEEPAFGLPHELEEGVEKEDEGAADLHERPVRPLAEAAWGDEPPPALEEPAQPEEAPPAPHRAAVEPPRPTRPPLRPRPGPAPRPRPAGRRRRGLLIGLAVGLGAVGGGWWLLGRGAAPADPPPEPAVEVAIPALPAVLEDRMRDLAAGVHAETLERLRERALAIDLPEEPPEDWLGGVYLANASRYPGVESYWTGLESHMRSLQATEDSLFVATLTSRLARDAFEPDTLAMLEDRILSGFRATSRERGAVFQNAREISGAAVRLHAFLIDNEANIAYEPAAAGLSRDPVLEAVPITPQLGEEMWEGVGEITDAMDALGFLDRVTTERIVTALIDRLSAIPIR